MISPSLVYAQTQSPTFHYLSQEEGLSQASNDFIYHDSKGFVWLSSIDGLNRYDGRSVKIYKSIPGDSTSLLGNIITSNFYEDQQANLWFTSYEGIHCYIREKDCFQHFQIKKNKEEYLQKDYQAFYLDQEDQLWIRVGIGPTAKLYLFDIKTKSHLALCTIDGPYNFPLLDKKGKVTKIVSANTNGRKGMTVLDTQAPFDMDTLFDGNQAERPGLDIIDFTSLNKGGKAFWYLGTFNGLVIFEPKTKYYQLKDKFEGLDIGHVNSTLVINDSILWATCSNLGVLIFNYKREQFVGKIPSDDPKKLGLSIKMPNKLYKDHHENVWISSFSSGVNYTNLKKQKFENINEFLGQNITSIFESAKGELFCSYSNGRTVYYENYQNKKQAPLLLPTIKNKQALLFLFEYGEGELWAVSSNQLLKWNETQLQFDFVKNLPSYILYLYQLQNKQILFATYQGIYEFELLDQEVVFNPFLPLGELQQVLATYLYETEDEKLYLAVDASKALVLQKNNENYTIVNQIEGIGYAKDFHEDEQYVWIATSNGILKVNKSDGTNEILNGLESGIPNESYYCIIPDTSGSFWLSCNRGLIQYFPKEKEHHRYTLFDGLQALEYNTNAFEKTSNGEIWIGGTKGLNRFFSAQIKKSLHSPQIQITSLRVNDELFKTEKQIGELQELTLDYYNNTLSFDFVALAYSDPKNNRLQYQLQNHEDSWVDAEKSGFARYSNLASGKYLFKIRASNSDGVWNEQTYSLAILIKKPWWQTWWFYLCSLILVGAIVYSFVWYRLQQVLKIERLRVKISSDLHDDVGSTLAGLTMQSEILAQTASQEQQPRLQRISELSRNAMSKMRDTVWAIDSRKDKFKDLLDRIRDHAIETLELNNILFDLKVIDISPDKKMATRIRQNLYLICKEAITNTAKHSNGDQLQITFTKNGRTGIELIIYDNGNLKNKIFKNSGLGLSNIQMRANEINGNLEINTDEGFLIRLIISRF